MQRHQVSGIVFIACLLCPYLCVCVCVCIHTLTGNCGYTFLQTYIFKDIVCICIFHNFSLFLFLSLSLSLSISLSLSLSLLTYTRTLECELMHTCKYMLFFSPKTLDAFEIRLCEGSNVLSHIKSTQCP